MSLIIGKIGLDITLGCISGMIATTKNIYNMVNFMNKDPIKPNEKILIFINKLDLINSVKIIENLLREIKLDDNTSNTLSLCIQNINEVIIEIEMELSYIKSILLYNRSLYIFKNIRSYKFDDNIEKLSILKQKLDTRTKLLLNILNIEKVLQKCPIELPEIDSSWTIPQKYDDFA